MHLSIRFAFLTFLFFSTTLFASVDDDERPLAPPNNDTTQSDGLNETAELHNAGIETQALKPVAATPKFDAFGTVLDLAPLLTLRQQYLAAQAQQDSAAAKYRQSELNLGRTRNLHKHDIVSTRRLQEQDAQWRSDKANLATSHYQQETLLNAGRLQWGDVLTRWFTQPHDIQAEQLLNHRAQLIEITLPANTFLNSDVRDIEVDLLGRRDEAINATFISPAPQIDPVTQGKRYFFKVEGNKLPYGAHISAWIPTGKQNTLGVVIPEKAVVWHLGQAFVFIRTDNGQFSRRTLPAQIPVKGGYFVDTGFEAGEEIVITGAQTLLSQELKKLIPDEDND